MPKLLFGGILATILLSFYMWSIYEAVQAAQEALKLAKLAPNAEAAAAAFKTAPELTTMMSVLLNSIGALVSATVVGVLGATTSGEWPAKRTLQENLTGTLQMIAGYMPSVYIFVWIGCGVWMCIIAFWPDSGQDFSDKQIGIAAKSWLGTAIAAVYAYFGITPDPPKANNAGGGGAVNEGNAGG